MMGYFSSFLSKLDSIRLSAGQWLLGSLVAVIGVLLAILKLQGSKLHKTQVQLLETQVNAKGAEDDNVTSKAQDKYQEALNDFLKNGGKL